MTPAPDVDISPACALSAQARIYSAPEYTLHQSLLCTRVNAAPDFSVHQILLCTRIYSAPE